VWHALLLAYEKTVFKERRELWESLNKKELGPEFLWLGKPGGTKNPSPKIRFCQPGAEGDTDKSVKPLWNAVSRMVAKQNLEERLGHAVDFYCLRHSFATNFLIRAVAAEQEIMKSKGLAAKDTETIIRDINLRAKLQRQLGHEDFSTTWDHYVHNVIEDGTMTLPSVLDLMKGDVFK
jgi:hypothetical protein